MPLSVHGPLVFGLPCTVEPISVHGLLVTGHRPAHSDYLSKNTNFPALFQPFTKRGRVIEMDARPLQTLAVIDLLGFVERRV